MHAINRCANALNEGRLVVSEQLEEIDNTIDTGMTNADAATSSFLSMAAERLSIVRYVFLVHVEDGIPSAYQRSCLEYADAVLIGWPDDDSDDVVRLDAHALNRARANLNQLESQIALFTTHERKGNIDGLAHSLASITQFVANIRRIYQPSFPLPTFEEICEVVQEEWEDDMQAMIGDDKALQKAIEPKSPPAHQDM